MTAFERLTDSVGVSADALPTLANVDAATLETVADAVDRLIEAEDVAVDHGIKEAVAIVPRPLRGVARNLLFGEG